MTSQKKSGGKGATLGSQSTPQTLRDHLKELQGRLFAVVTAFVIVAAASYPFFDRIAALITAPLKDNQELVYLTPGGAIGFMIQVSVYVGLIGALPVIIFHIYRFIMPIVKYAKLKTALCFTLTSLFLAICGIIFAYVVSLPAALYFLTSFDIANIKPMLTVDSYFSFVMTYVLAGAALFQLPLVLLIINKATPLTPRKMMRYQRQIILGSFIIAAIITPTPDPLNQTLLAAPVVVMYQLGITLVWLVNRRSRPRQMDGMKPVAAQRASKTVVVVSDPLMYGIDKAALAASQELSRSTTARAGHVRPTAPSVTDRSSMMRPNLITPPISDLNMNRYSPRSSPVSRRRVVDYQLRRPALSPTVVKRSIRPVATRSLADIRQSVDGMSIVRKCD